MSPAAILMWFPFRHPGLTPPYRLLRLFPERTPGIEDYQFFTNVSRWRVITFFQQRRFRSGHPP